jgi:hypothetical protein
MLVGYDIANPPGYTHNPLMRLGQTVTATYNGTRPVTSRNFVVTGILEESGNPNVDRIVKINTNTGNSFFHKLGQYDVMVVLALPCVSKRPSSCLVSLTNHKPSSWNISCLESITFLLGTYDIYQV